MDFTKLVSPIKGLQMLKAGIEKNVGQPINHFEINYIAEKEDIYFKVYLPDGRVIGESYSGANKMMMLFTIKSVVKTKLAANESLDLVKCEYNPDETLNLFICFTRGTEKIKHEIKNYKP